jgi:hypothetical protein
MKRKFTFLVLVCFLLMAKENYAQTVYRSIGSGTWATLTIWDKSTDGGVTWGASVTAAPTSNQGVIIQSGTTVTLDATKSCRKLVIQSGGRLSAGVSTNAIRAGQGSSGTAGNVDTVQNDGILGGPGELMVLELPATCASLLLTGSGSYEIGRIRAITANANNPTSATTGHANDAKLIIDKDVKLNTAANYCFSIPNSTVSATDVISFNINSGKIITVTDPTSKWENSIMASNGATTGGIYTYNINGTLDLSATTATSAFIPYSNSTSSIIVNVNGTVKLGTSFKADTVAGSLGGIFLNVNNGGLVDATNTTSFNVGKTGTTANTTNGNIFWVLSGNGAIKRTVPATATKINFPVGTGISSYTPVSITRDASVGSSATYTVGIQNTFDNAPADLTKSVQRQWNISTTGGSISDTLRFSWTTAEQGAGFNPANPVSIMHWNGTSWDYTAATISGTGTSADPYIAKAYGFSSFSPFGVTNIGPIPLSLLSFTAAYTLQKVNLNWVTTNEANVKNFTVERSEDGRAYTALSSIKATNLAGNNNYYFEDLMPLTGSSFYRLKITDNDGRFKYSNIIAFNTRSKSGISLYPNPAAATITVNHGKQAEAAMIRIVSTDGRTMGSNKIMTGALQSSLDISALAPGTYFVLTGNSDNKNALRFVKN